MGITSTPEVTTTTPAEGNSNGSSSAPETTATTTAAGGKGRGKKDGKKGGATDAPKRSGGRTTTTTNGVASVAPGTDAPAAETPAGSAAEPASEEGTNPPPKKIKEYQIDENSPIKKYKVPVHQIVIDPAIRAIRGKLDAKKVAEYAFKYQEAEELPPGHLFTTDGKTFVMAGGDHRLEAHKKLNFGTFEAFVHYGTREQALAFAMVDNAKSGLPLSNASKRYIVEQALLNPSLVGNVDSSLGIAKALGHVVSDRFVGNVRTDLENEGKLDRKETVTTAAGVEYSKGGAKAPVVPETDSQTGETKVKADKDSAEPTAASGSDAPPRPQKSSKQLYAEAALKSMTALQTNLGELERLGEKVPKPLSTAYKIIQDFCDGIIKAEGGGKGKVKATGNV